MKVLIRDRMVTLEEAALKLHITDGGTNSGPWVDKFLREVGLNPGYAWCDADQSYYEHEAAGKRLPIESASVLQTWNMAGQLGWRVSTPARGDLVLYRWTGSGPPFGDHIGIVVSATSVGAYWKLNTIEGNTSSGVAGSQSDGDGMYARTRIVSKSMCGFVRIPGYVDLAPVKSLTHPVGKPLPAAKLVKKTAVAKSTVTKATAKKTAAKSSAKKTAAKKAPQLRSERGKNMGGDSKKTTRRRPTK